MNLRISLRPVFLLFAAFATTYSFASAQAFGQDNDRPEWQVFADLEFRSSCQSSLQKLCSELLRSYQEAPADHANSKLLIVAQKLLEVPDENVPAGLPEHPATIEYVKARKSAVILWNKRYRQKGESLSPIQGNRTLAA